jgi:hypothetical protein
MPTACQTAREASSRVHSTQNHKLTKRHFRHGENTRVTYPQPNSQDRPPNSDPTIRQSQGQANFPTAVEYSHIFTQYLERIV